LRLANAVSAMQQATGLHACCNPSPSGPNRFQRLGHFL